MIISLGDVICAGDAVTFTTYRINDETRISRIYDGIVFSVPGKTLVELMCYMDKDGEGGERGYHRVLVGSDSAGIWRWCNRSGGMCRATVEKNNDGFFNKYG